LRVVLELPEVPGRKEILLSYNFIDKTEPIGIGRR